jgi:hypothetical protein
MNRLVAKRDRPMNIYFRNIKEVEQNTGWLDPTDPA